MLTFGEDLNIDPFDSFALRTVEFVLQFSRLLHKMLIGLHLEHSFVYMNS